MNFSARSWYALPSTVRPTRGRRLHGPCFARTRQPAAPRWAPWVWLPTGGAGGSRECAPRRQRKNADAVSDPSGLTSKRCFIIDYLVITHNTQRFEVLLCRSNLSCLSDSRGDSAYSMSCLPDRQSVPQETARRVQCNITLLCGPMSRGCVPLGER